jgi:DNA-binding response OmpR family regulator
MNVLIVDSDKARSAANAMLFSTRGYTVLLADYGEQAISIIQDARDNLALIISEIDLNKEVDGWSVLLEASGLKKTDRWILSGRYNRSIADLVEDLSIDRLVLHSDSKEAINEWIILHPTANFVTTN